MCELEGDTASPEYGSLTKSYIYADGQILSQRIHDDQDPYDYTPYYYVHDRLGSVRLMINNSGTAVNSYTYKPYGQFYDGECNETMLDNPWAFTGQYYDEEIAQYYLRARQYDPAMMRFTSRDPAFGKFTEPQTLHKYLYCWNNSTNRRDPSGLYTGYDDGAFFLAGAISGLIGQAFSDYLAGSFSGFDMYLASGFAGGVGGWASLYGGPIIGGAIGSGLTELFHQTVTQSALNWSKIGQSALIGGALGCVPSQALTSGRNGLGAITAQMVSKMRNGLITNVTSKTFSKIILNNIIVDSFSTTMQGGSDGWSRRGIW